MNQRITTFAEWRQHRHPEPWETSPMVRARWRKVRWLDFCTPDNITGFKHSVGDHGPQAAFYVYQWMVRTAGQGRYHSVLDGLSKRSCIGLRHVDGFGPDWSRDLAERLWWGVLAQHCDQRWREKNGIRIDGSKQIPINAWHCRSRDRSGFRGSATFDEAFAELFALAGRRFIKSPNSCHRQATTIHAVYLRVYPDDFGVDVLYGYFRDRSSSWTHDLHSAHGEPLIDFVCRAADVVRRETVAVNLAARRSA